ncbi:MAG: hypothetical protein JWM63_1156 [Gammaproteobacteria bacterium]|nr:hypothetical protein [Gammaproteobacteria bacterium]
MSKFVPTLLLIPVCLLTVGVAYSADAPHGTMTIAAISALDAPVPGRAALDLGPPEPKNVQWTDLPPATGPQDSDEPQAIAIVIGSSLPEERWSTYISRAGIGSLYWAARHPAQAWRVLLPVQRGDEFEAYVAINAKCTVVPSAPAARAACP